MTWLNLPALTALAAIGVPVLIHLLGRRQARREKFPTLRFLDPSRLLPTRRTRLTDLLLLAVRCAIIAAAALALAEPRFSTAARATSLQNTVARAIILDTSASMGRLSPAGAPGPRLLDAARATATRLASEATESLIIESATPARAIAGAVDWLRTQSGRASIVLVSDFQRGTLDSAMLAVVPADMGIAPTAVATPVDTVPTPVTVRGGTLVTTARLSRTTDRATVEWTSTPVANDTAARSPTLLTAVRERAAAAAAWQAAASAGNAWSTTSAQPIAIVYPSSEQRAELARAAKPLVQPWMSNLVARVRADSSLIVSAATATPITTDLPEARRDTPLLVVSRNGPGLPIALAGTGTVQGRETLLLFANVEAGSLASAALIGAVAHAGAAATPVSEFEPATIPLDQLRRWERPALPLARPSTNSAGDSDGRWFWMIALVLLALEGWMRRAKRERVESTRFTERSHERAA